MMGVDSTLQHLKPLMKYSCGKYMHYLVSTALALEHTLSSAQFWILPRCAIFGSVPVPDTSLGQARWIFFRVKALLRSGSVGVDFVPVLRVGSSDG